MELPSLRGDSIEVSVQTALVAHRGLLVGGPSVRGSAVYAAAFLPERKIVLEAALLAAPAAFRSILIHELFHFVWRRLSNAARCDFNGLLLQEREKRARGELGESSGVGKALLERAGSSGCARIWRDYVCESFCDTAAWVYRRAEDSGGVCTLAKRWRNRRRAWFEAAAGRGPWKC